VSDANKALVLRLIEGVWDRGDFALVDELIAVDYFGHASTPADEAHGQEGYRRFHAALRTAFPNLRSTVEDQIAEGDRVVTRWTCRATHTGEFRGIPPTGKKGCVSGITIDRIAYGKVVECWTNADDLGLLQQLGVLPAPEQARR
jgi:steroid delta-isomerase-like uncharacterized protein